MAEVGETVIHAAVAAAETGEYFGQLFSFFS